MQIFLVATFTSQPFRGNPAGVCVFEGPLPEPSSLQAIASELNQPQTAFIAPLADDCWSIRWFSPKVEVALCGHATLAASHVLLKQRNTGKSSVSYAYPAGVLGATLRDGRVWLDLPATHGHNEAAPDLLLQAVNAPPIATSRHTDRWIFEYDGAEHVRSLQVDYEKVLRTGIRSLIVTAPSDLKGYDIVSRNFAPIVGVNEDHATGAAHCCLGPYWLERLGPSLTCWQASARTGVLHVRTLGKRVEIGGDAVTMISGQGFLS